jgi:hypothetical protein
VEVKRRRPASPILSFDAFDAPRTGRPAMRDQSRAIGRRLYDGVIATEVDETGLPQRMPKRGQRLAQSGLRPAIEISDHRHGLLLRPRRERPCRRSAAEQRDDLAPFQMVELHLVPFEPGKMRRTRTEHIWSAFALLKILLQQYRPRKRTLERTCRLFGPGADIVQEL